jgi:hypothetical protein
LLVFAVALTLSLTLAPTSYASGLANTYQQTPAATANASPCVSPPAGFDPLSASDAQLLYYGLPRRPTTTGPNFDQWVMVVTHAKKRGCEAHVDTAIPAHPHVKNPLGWAWQNGYNWSGWEVASNIFYTASGQWTVPCIDTSKSPTGSDISNWVGLGGDNGGNLWQAGTYWPNDKRTWYAFYEYVTPTGGIKPQLLSNAGTIACGHHMFAEIDYGQTYSGQSYLLVEDLTNGGYWPGHVSFQPDTSTAEWMEDTSYCTSNNWRQHADFGQVNWTYAKAGQAYSTEQPISFWPTENRSYSTASPSDGTLTAEPGMYGSDGESFTDYWYANGKNYC